jgi:hypothetical protein
MEHCETINRIINTNKEHLTNKNYKSFCKVINNLSKNKKFKKMPDSVLQYSCIVLIETIDILKEHVRDIDYINYMNSLKFLVEKIKKTDDNYDDDEDYRVDYHDYYNYYNNYDDHQIIDIDLLLERIEYNKLILNDFIKEKNLPIDFIDSSFNVSYVAAYNYIYDNCSCDNNEYMGYICKKHYYCKNIQKYILNNPIVFIIINSNNRNNIATDKICYDIKKYNLFSFDGKISNSFLLDLSSTVSVEAKKDLDFMMSLFHSRGQSIQVLLFINIINIIYTKYYNLLKTQRFRHVLYAKIIEFKEFNYYANEWSDKLNLEQNILDIISNNFREHFPIDI